jgi:hypothetical protein
MRTGVLCPPDAELLVGNKHTLDRAVPATCVNGDCSGASRARQRSLSTE